MNFITWFVKTYRKDIIENGVVLAALYFIMFAAISAINSSWILFLVTYAIGIAICGPVVYVLLKEKWDKLYSHYERTRKE